MTSAFRLCAIGALAIFGVLGAVRGHGDPPTPDPAEQLVDQLRAAGYRVSPPKTVLWGVPAVAVSVADCPAAIDAIVFDFDEIMSPGILAGVTAADRGVLQVTYAGQSFSGLDRAALYRLRLRNGIAGFIHTGQLVDPPVILLFWPSACRQRAIL